MRVRGWHVMRFGPDLWRFNPTSSNEAQEDKSLHESVSGMQSLADILETPSPNQIKQRSS
jgi:hypothetical protein